MFPEVRQSADQRKNENRTDKYPGFDDCAHLCCKERSTDGDVAFHGQHHCEPYGRQEEDIQQYRCIRHVYVVCIEPGVHSGHVTATKNAGEQ